MCVRQDGEQSNRDLPASGAHLALIWPGWPRLSAPSLPLQLSCCVGAEREEWTLAPVQPSTPLSAGFSSPACLWCREWRQPLPWGGLVLSCPGSRAHRHSSRTKPPLHIAASAPEHSDASRTQAQRQNTAMVLECRYSSRTQLCFQNTGTALEHSYASRTQTQLWNTAMVLEHRHSSKTQLWFKNTGTAPKHSYGSRTQAQLQSTAMVLERRHSSRTQLWF